MLTAFCRSRAGNFATMFAVVLPAVLLAVGLALDVSNLMTAKASLQNALDAALLASSRLQEKDKPRKKTFENFFAANIAGHADIVNARAELTVTEGLNVIETKATATADVVLQFAFLFGDSARVAAEAAAFEATSNLEIVMVLDNTGSMAGKRIAALRTAATSLVNMLETAANSGRTVKVALVPFVTAVNVKGAKFDPSWIDMTGANPTNGLNFGRKTHHIKLFQQLGLDWKGCVEARPGTQNISDAAPDKSKPETLFVPYFAPDDPGGARSPSGSYGNSATDYNNSYLDDMVPLGIDLDVIGSLAKYVFSTLKLVSEKGPLTVGPNRSCPTPIVPLSTDFNALRKAVSEMIEWNGSGTNVSEGLSWGMRVLSPGQPYDQGAPFRNSGTTKIVLLLTDGENVVYGSKNKATKSDYGAYGYLASGRFGSDNQSTAARNVDGWTLDVCNALKNNDVQIYTVLLEADTAANRKLYSACASSPANYYPTNDVSQLDAVFRQIGASIAKLQLTN